MSNRLYFIALTIVALLVICPETAAKTDSPTGVQTFAQPADLSPDDNDVIPQEDPGPNVVVDRPGAGEPIPADSIVTQPKQTLVWIRFLPNGMEWIIGIGVLLVLWVLTYMLYRLLLPGTIRKPKHPANLRALMLMLAGLIFLLWTYFWFVIYLDAFGLLMGGVLIVLALILLIVGLVARK